MFQIRNSRRLAALALPLGCFMAFAGLAKADLTYDLTVDSCSSACGPQAVFGVVDLSTVNVDTVQVKVTLNNGNEFVTTGTHTGVAFDIQGAQTVTLGTLPTGYVSAGTNTTVSEPGLGDFTDGIDCSKGNTTTKKGCAGSDPWSGTLEFDVSRSTGLTLSDFTTDNKGYSFAVDIISGTTGKTGLVGSTTPVSGQNPLPEPSYVLLLIAAATGFTTRKLVTVHRQ